MSTGREKGCQGAHKLGHQTGCRIISLSGVLITGLIELVRESLPDRNDTQRRTLPARHDVCLFAAVVADEVTLNLTFST